MAKKKYEFKPDKSGQGFLARLYLTRIQRRRILHWALYALFLLAASVIQDVILCKLRLFGAGVELVPCIIILICLLEGSEQGSWFSLIASLCYLLSGTAPGVYAMVYLTAVAIGAAIVRQSYLQKTFGALMLCTVGGLLFYELFVFFTGIFLGLTHIGRLQGFMLTALLSALAAPVLYVPLRGIGNIGGEVWKE